MSGPIEVWRGGVNAWDCDVMGHMNVRFYVARALEGLVETAAALGLPEAFSPRAGGTLRVREHHIRFLREARVDAPLHMMMGVESFDPAGEAVLLQTLIHSHSGQTAATIRTRVSHTSPVEGRTFPWPSRTEPLAQALMVEVPPEAAERGLAPRPPAWSASMAAADRLNLSVGARGAVTPADCDLFGRMRLELFMGRIVDAMPYLVKPIKQAASQDNPDAGDRIGGASIEFRLAYIDPPRVGDRLVLRSGLAAAAPKVQTLVHWLLDPMTGRAYGSAEMVIVNFDLEARKAMTLGPAGLAALQALVIPGLTM